MHKQIILKYVHEDNKCFDLNNWNPLLPINIPQDFWPVLMVWVGVSVRVREEELPLFWPVLMVWVGVKFEGSGRRITSFLTSVNGVGGC